MSRRNDGHRPDGTATVQVTVRLDAELVEALRDEADARVLGFALLVNRLLALGLAQLPPLSSVFYQHRPVAAEPDAPIDPDDWLQP